MFNSWPHQLNCSAVDAADGALATHAKPGDVPRYLQGYQGSLPCSGIGAIPNAAVCYDGPSFSQTPTCNCPILQPTPSLSLLQRIIVPTCLPTRYLIFGFHKIADYTAAFPSSFPHPPSVCQLFFQLQSSHGRLCWKTESRRIGTCKHGPRRGMPPQRRPKHAPAAANIDICAQRTEAIHVLDMQYQDTMHRTDIVVKDEEARRLKLRVMVLRDEAGTLRDHLAEKDSKMRKLSQQYEDICVQLDRMNHTCANQETQLRSQSRQQAELKVLNTTPNKRIIHALTNESLTNDRPS